MSFTEIENAIAAIARGELVIVVDDADRENEGDLIMAAEAMTPEAMAFMIRHTSGVICMPVEGARLDELRLPLMVADNTESQRTAFTVSVDARQGTTTGISAADRCTTVHALLDAATRPEDHAVTFFTRMVAAHTPDEARSEVLSMREATEHGWRVNTVQAVA